MPNLYHHKISPSTQFKMKSTKHFERHATVESPFTEVQAGIIRSNRSLPALALPSPIGVDDCVVTDDSICTSFSSNETIKSNLNHIDDSSSFSCNGRFVHQSAILPTESLKRNRSRSSIVTSSDDENYRDPRSKICLLEESEKTIKYTQIKVLEHSKKRPKYEKFHTIIAAAFSVHGNIDGNDEDEDEGDIDDNEVCQIVESAVTRLTEFELIDGRFNDKCLFESRSC